jgi:hypothetical protein
MRAGQSQCSSCNEARHYPRHARYLDIHHFVLFFFGGFWEMSTQKELYLDLGTSVRKQKTEMHVLNQPAK